MSRVAELRDESLAAGPWILTRSGKQFHLLNPSPEEIDIQDIAHALSHINRWGGHTEPSYSVAEHSMCVCELVTNRYGHHFALDGLMHDAAEAYIGDISSPIKRLIIPVMIEVEDRITQAIAEKFGISYPIPPEIKSCDRDVAATEARRFFNVHDTSNEGWLIKGKPDETVKIACHTPALARQIFLNTFNYIYREWR